MSALDELKMMFIEAALDQDFKKCRELKELLGDALDKPYVAARKGNKLWNVHAQ
jgi:hypothetical protein